MLIWTRTRHIHLTSGLSWRIDTSSQGARTYLRVVRVLVFWVRFGIGDADLLSLLLHCGEPCIASPEDEISITSQYRSAFLACLNLNKCLYIRFYRPKSIIKSHRIAQSETWAASRIGVCISLLTYACPGRHVFIGPHLYSEQVLTADSDRECNALRVSYCTPKPKSGHR